MKSKKLLVMVLVLLAGIMAFSQDMEAYQYSYKNGDFGLYSTSQIGLASKMITVKVKGGTTAYITNYVDDWYGGPIEDLGNPSYSLGYDMRDGKYGYVFAEIDADGNATPTGGIHWADGTQETITYRNPRAVPFYGEVETQEVTGYKLGEFKDDAEIFLVMTPRGYEGTYVTSYELLSEYSEGNPTGLQSIFKSRQVNTWDQANSGRVNFAFGPKDEPNNQGVSHEFVIGYMASNDPAPSGQPLPGVLTSCLIGLAATSIAARRRKHSKK